MVALIIWHVSTFFERMADILAPRLCVVFCLLLLLGSFLACLRHSDVTPIPEDPPSSIVENNPPISVTPVLSMMFERLVKVSLSRFIKHRGVLPTTQFDYKKCLGACNTLQCMRVSHFTECIGVWA